MLNEQEKITLQEIGKMLEKIINWKPEEKPIFEKVLAQVISKDMLLNFGRKRTALIGICLVLLADTLMDNAGNEQVIKDVKGFVQ